ncbi:MAG: PSD1 and planctomycete cytochrome C domain-containing protein [Isosphaeraceae bacterium]
MRNKALRLGLLLGLAGTVFETGGSAARAADRARSVLARCASCHGLGPSGDESAGGLDLTRRESALQGGDSGPGLVPGDPSASLLFKRAAAGKMPPKPGKPLTNEEVDALRAWIQAGAVWEGPVTRSEAETAVANVGQTPGGALWSLRPLTDPATPALKRQGWARDPIDTFILARMEAEGLSPAPEADRAAYVRRVTFDLTGLPPSPDEVEAFIRDDRPDAYERLVDRLLASPAFGERWGRHWLDLARFAESHGFEYDRLRDHSWPYRDYVIGSLNADVPYTTFVAEQVAGDVLRPDSPDAVSATGFLVAGPWDEAGSLGQKSVVMKARLREEELEDMVSAVSQTFLGLTVNCARCHDHKFDPIPQRDYYRMKAALEGVRHGNRPLPGPRMEPQPMAYAANPSPPPPTQILGRGDVANPGEVVSAGGISAVPGPSSDFGLPADAPEADRRRALADWLTHPENPLPPRVAVNRLWHYHFGSGLVGSPSDFGANGEAPSHPELLDRLAIDFREGGWRLNPMHRRFVLSSTYRQSSRFDPKAGAVDGESRLLWRYPPRRLEGEEVRDAMLAASGTLHRKMGGPGYRPFVIKTFNSNFYEMIPNPSGPEFDRRTIYRIHVNSARSPLLESLDCPDPSVKTPRRSVTTTPLQALSLMNDPFALRMARELAARAVRESGHDPSRQIARAFALVLGRAPDATEVERATELVHREGLESLAWVLFNANEFLTIR